MTLVLISGHTLASDLSNLYQSMLEATMGNERVEISRSIEDLVQENLELVTELERLIQQTPLLSLHDYTLEKVILLSELSNNTTFQDTMTARYEQLLPVSSGSVQLKIAGAMEEFLQGRDYNYTLQVFSILESIEESNDITRRSKNSLTDTLLEGLSEWLDENKESLSAEQRNDFLNLLASYLTSGDERHRLTAINAIFNNLLTTVNLERLKNCLRTRVSEVEPLSEDEIASITLISDSIIFGGIPLIAIFGQSLIDNSPEARIEEIGSYSSEQVAQLQELISFLVME